MRCSIPRFAPTRSVRNTGPIPRRLDTRNQPYRVHGPCTVNYIHAFLERPESIDSNAVLVAAQAQFDF
jgi:hypothetical protein